MLIFISVKLKSIKLQVKLGFETSCRSEFKLKLTCVIKPTPSDYLQKTCTKKYKRKWLKAKKNSSTVKASYFIT